MSVFSPVDQTVLCIEKYHYSHSAGVEMGHKRLDFPIKTCCSCLLGSGRAESRTPVFSDPCSVGCEAFTRYIGPQSATVQPATWDDFVAFLLKETSFLFTRLYQCLERK